MLYCDCHFTIPQYRTEDIDKMEVIFMSIKKEEIPGDINFPDIKSEPDENCMDVVEGETGDCSDTLVQPYPDPEEC